MEKEFVSELEKILSATELNFEPTPSFGPYKQYLEHAIAHPAKANTLLLEYLILNFTEENDTILDPMAGTGSTAVVAALHGRNAIGVEIEPKFFEWMEEARRKVETTETLTPKGRIVNILGDARRLSELLGQVDACITSPPFGETYLGSGDPERRKERLIMAGYDPKDFLGGRARNAILKHYSEVGEIITNLPSKENIGNLPFGSIDAIITSPPYLKSADQGAGINRQREGDVKIGCSTVGRTVSHPDAIDNVKEYGDIEATHSKKGETYLEAMLKVYREMFKVLKPSGRAIVIIKPFIRNKKVVDLPYHTWLLMQRAGFELEKLFKLRLKQMSFWRILYAKKHPNVPLINHEYIIVAKKPL